MKNMVCARNWMKKNASFLNTWHAYVGYELKLFDAFHRPVTIEDVADAYKLDEQLLQQWVTIGVSIGHLKRKQRNLIQTSSKWQLPYASEEASAGALLKEMMELHIPALLKYPQLMREKSRQSFTSDTHAETIAQTSRLLEALTLPKIIAVLKRSSASSLLDVGCGEAGYITKLAKKNNHIQFTGIEVSEKVAEKAKRKTESFHNVNIVYQDVWNYETEKKYDVVLLNNVLHYVAPAERKSLVMKLSSWLRKGGKLVVISPIVNESNAKPFVAAFNGFFHTFDNLYALPTDEELQSIGDEANLFYDCRDLIITEGSWYSVYYTKK